MTQFVKDRLARLTNGEVKKIVSDAVAADKAKKSKAGAKLLEQYNKLYVEILKFKKVYDARMPEVEKLIKETGGKDIDNEIFDEAAKAIADLRHQWAAIVDSFRKFEKVEADLKEEYDLN